LHAYIKFTVEINNLRWVYYGMQYAHHNHLAAGAAHLAYTPLRFKATEEGAKGENEREN